MKKKNPGGRPVGTYKISSTDVLRTLIRPHRNEVFEVMLEKAKNGDPAMLKFFGDRIFPEPVKDTLLPHDIIVKGKTRMAKAIGTLELMFRGKIGINACNGVLSAIEKVGAIELIDRFEVDLKELKRRREEEEEKIKQLGIKEYLQKTTIPAKISLEQANKEKEDENE